MTDITCPLGIVATPASDPVSLTPAFGIDQMIGDVPIVMTISASTCTNFTFANSTITSNETNITIATPFEMTCTANYTLQFGTIVNQQNVLELTPREGRAEQVVECGDLNSIKSCAADVGVTSNSLVTNSDALALGTAAFDLLFGELVGAFNYTNVLMYTCPTLEPYPANIVECGVCVTETDDPTPADGGNSTDTGTDTDTDAGTDSDTDGGTDNATSTPTPTMTNASSDSSGDDTSNGITVFSTFTMTALGVIFAVMMHI